jgi:serine kinase of HPr protein (carbohydrate metabolism regulator)
LAKIPQSKDEALEALDFIVNVLKEHEKDLDKLINELGTVTEQIGDTGELSNKVENVEQKINNLQKEVTNLIGYMSSTQSETTQTAPKELASALAAPTVVFSGGPSIVLKCQQWDDFLNLAAKAQTLSFSFKEDEKVFQVSAHKGNQLLTYSGALPKLSTILKVYLSKQLDIPQQGILEGVLAVS